MKRVVSIVLCIVMVCTLCWGFALDFSNDDLMLVGAACAENYSSMTTEELHTAINLMRNELVKRELGAGEKILIFEEGGVSLYLTGEYKVSNKGVLTLNTLLINDNSDKVTVYADDLTCSVNGWDVACHTSIDANGGKKSKGHFEIYLNGAEISTYEEIEEIELRIYYKVGSERTRFDPITLQFPIK